MFILITVDDATGLLLVPISSSVVDFVAMVKSADVSEEAVFVMITTGFVSVGTVVLDLRFEGSVYSGGRGFLVVVPGNVEVGLLSPSVVDFVAIFTSADVSEDSVRGCRGLLVVVRGNGKVVSFTSVLIAVWGSSVSVMSVRITEKKQAISIKQSYVVFSGST